MLCELVSGLCSPAELPCRGLAARHGRRGCAERLPFGATSAALHPNPQRAKRHEHGVSLSLSEESATPVIPEFS